MRFFAVALALFFFLMAEASAQDIACGARGPDPKDGEVKLVSWNIAELASAVKVYDRPLRSEDDFSDLRMYRVCNGGDVYALQEIASLQALARVFPPKDFLICISGQTVADQRGLAPGYSPSSLAGIEPQCVSNAAAKASQLPAELTDPARQYVAVAVRRNASITIERVRDIVELGPDDPVTHRQTRWAMDISLGRNGARMRLLIVHMKASCNEGPIEDPSTNTNCPALLRQLQPLKTWIASAQNDGSAFAVVGDFNRRLDRESSEVKSSDLWDVITGASTLAATDDVALVHVPKNKEFKCWPKEPANQRFPIDFFVLNDKAQAMADAGSYWKWRYGKDIEEDTLPRQGPSDHCPIQLNIRF